MPSSACRHYRTARQAVHHSPHCPGSHCYCHPDPANDGPPWLMPCRDWKGLSYRSAIFYTSPEQKRTAAVTIADVEASRLWPGKIVTEVSPAGAFWEAEPEHQDYLQRIPDGYTCHFIRPDWKLPVRKVADHSAASAAE